MSEAPAIPAVDQPVSEPVVSADPVIVAEAVAAAPVVEAPAKRRGRKPKAVAAVQAPVAEAAPAVKAVVRKPAARKTKAAAKPAVKPVAIKPRTVKAAAAVKVTPAKSAAAKPTAAKPTAAKPALKIKTAPTPAPKAAGTKAPQPKSKDKIMANTPIDFTAAFKTAFTDFQEKAKTAYAKSTSAFGEANEFAKGNVEAFVEAGKIFASGIQELGTALTTESRTAFETLTAEAKELAAVKSPTEFVQLQSSLLRKHFDAIVAQTSKNTEAVLKLANETVAPISNRVTLAVEKVSKAA